MGSLTTGCTPLHRMASGEGISERKKGLDDADQTSAQRRDPRKERRGSTMLMYKKLLILGKFM